MIAVFDMPEADLRAALEGAVVGGRRVVTGKTCSFHTTLHDNKGVFVGPIANVMCAIYWLTVGETFTLVSVTP